MDFPDFPGAINKSWAVNNPKNGLNLIDPGVY